MESKTKHRILGILVIAGLVVILLPFFQHSKDISSETAMIQPPPFPDQSIQANATAQATTTVSPNDTPKQVEKAPEGAGIVSTQVSTQNPAPAPKSLPIIQKTADEIVKEHPDETIDTTQTTSQLMTPVIENPTINESTITPTEAETNTTNKPIKAKATHATKEQIKKKLVSSAKRKLTHRGNYLHLPIDNNGLANINSSVWVIQVGSFRNKANALRVVNKLRANGYRAFIQQVSTTFGKNTRVFVGPENKQAQAHALAQELEANMHLDGIVISYKPLAS